MLIVVNCSSLTTDPKARGLFSKSAESVFSLDFLPHLGTRWPSLSRSLPLMTITCLY